MPISFKIEKDIPFPGSKASPHFKMKRDTLWPNVEKMRPGNTYVIMYDKPNLLKRDFENTICKEKTGYSMTEMNLVAHVTAKEDGVVLVKL